jgi:hypothetical protein
MGKIELRRDYLNNARMFDALDKLLSLPDITERIDSVFIIGAASPIGGIAQNRWLSQRRARALQDYIHSKFPTVMNEQFSIKAIGVDYEGFEAIYKEEQDSVDALTQNQRRMWLLRDVYPRLQYVSIRLLLTDGTYIHGDNGSPLRAMIEQKATVHDTLRVISYDTVHVTVYDTVRTILADHTRTPLDTVPPPNDLPTDRDKEKPLFPSFLLTIKNNLIYDLALLPNLALEYSLTPRASIAIEGYWAWWDTKAPDYWSYRIQAIGVEGKYWMGNRQQRPRLTGHYLGVYALTGNYCIRLFPQSLSDMGDLSTSSYSAGITYGYVIPVGKRWDMEFSMGVGYFGGTYYKYNRSECIDCYPVRGRKQRNYLGPTRVAVNLIYRIGMPHEKK